MLTVLLILAVLASLALPGLAAQARAARRAEAIATLLLVHQAQERWRAQCPCHAANLGAPPHPTLPGGCPAVPCDPAHGLGLQLTSERYTYDIVVVPTPAMPDRYTVHAVALGDQSADRAGSSSCAVLMLVVLPGQVRHEPGTCFRQ